MVSTFQMQAFYRANNPLTVDTAQAQKYFEEEDGILDDNILDHSALDSGLEMSPPMADSRRESFAVSSSLFSPKTEDWQSVDMQSVPSNNPFLEPQSNNPFMRMDQSQGYAAQGQWNMSQGSGTCTPLQQFDGLAGEYDGSAPVFQQSMPTQTPFTNPTGQVPLFQNVGPNGHSIPTSPMKGWMGPDLKGPQSMAKRMRPDSPTIRSHNELRRGDGIRKKNARFDIPAERNLNNIDQLIAQSTDEQEIKELKQQKRLLRNRQAALDSRQRKKLHTERLEDEKKQFTAIVTDQEDQITKLTQDLQQIELHYQEALEALNRLNVEKEQLIQSHTIETGELRKKVSVLTDHVKRLENANMPSNAGYSAGFNDMEMTIDPSWDNMGFFGDMPMEGQQQEVKQELQVVPTRKTEISLPAEVEKPSTQGGLLFMLFLVGAFVLSNRSTPSIPHVSEDVRVASATLLDNIFKDAGVAQMPDSIMAAAAPRPSGASWAAGAASMSGASMTGIAPSTLGDLADSLTQPTQDQQNEQLFSMTPAQYNGVMSQDFLQNAPAKPANQRSRNLAESLAALRNNQDKHSAAEVYTRSLLWDQIPGDVVRNFARMVAEANNNQNERSGNEAIS